MVNTPSYHQFASGYRLRRDGSGSGTSSPDALRDTYAARTANLRGGEVPRVVLWESSIGGLYQ